MEEEAQLKYYESETPRFFRIILHETLQSGKLNFPKSFVQKHGGSLCLNKVYLRVSSGDLWKVEFHREEDGDMWLHNGWQDFVEFYDIKFGYFLVFDYQGNSEFLVFIFDKTTSEIKYPCKCSNNIGNSDLDPFLLSAKPEIEGSDVEMVVDHNACDSNCVFSNNRSKSTNQFGKESRDERFVHGELGNSWCREKAEAIIRTRSFNSSYPFFRIFMRRTYLNRNYGLHLPGKFIMDHIGRKDCYTKLSVPCGRSWIVKCRLRVHNNRPHSKIQVGWKSFAKDNKLVVGDVCVFELIDSVKVHFRVTIFRAAKVPILCPVKSESTECIDEKLSPKPLCHEEPIADIPFESPSNQDPKNPSFKVIMTEACMRRYHIPISNGFLKHIKQISQDVTRQDVTLEVAGRFWHLKCYYYPHIRQTILSHGWRIFVKENFLQVGDICIFELLDKEEMVFKVSINRGRR